MKRLTEERRDVPVLTVIGDTAAPDFAVLTMLFDWRNTGEVELRYATMEALEQLNEALVYASNAVADEVWTQRKLIQDESEGNENDTPPW